jgi:photosystem II stability/assembly factor-like uncharacterized protein
LLCLAFAGTSPGYGHTPHDTIDALEISREGSLFAVRGGRHLLKSRDGGASWKQLVNGLTTKYSYTDVVVGNRLDQPPVIYLATDGDGIFRSTDAGDSWASLNRGLDNLRIEKLAISPGFTNKHQVMAVTKSGSAYRLALTGRLWEKVAGSYGKVTAIALQEGGQGSTVLLGDESGGIYRSRDHGKTWDQAASLESAGAITTFGFLPSADSIGLLVGTASSGVLHSADGGKTFRQFGIGLEGKNIRSIAVSPAYHEDSTLLVSSWHDAVFKSTDSGSTWSKYNTGIESHHQADLPAFYSPHYRGICFGSEPGVAYLGGFAGLFKSTDLGESWQQLETEAAGFIWSLELSPIIDNDYMVALTTFNAGFYMRNSSEDSWQIRNYGLQSTRLRKPVFSPNFASDNIVFSAEDEGNDLLRSDNSGAFWRRTPFRQDALTHWKRKILGALHHRLGLPASITTELLSREEKIAANPKGLLLSPDFAEDGFLFATTRFRGNYVSEDGGVNLERIADPGFKLWEIAMSPDFPDDKTLFASAREKGVYRSHNGGKSWKPINAGLDFLADWRKFLEDPERRVTELGQSRYYDIELLVSPSYVIDKTLFAYGGEGIFVSTDLGNSWKAVDSMRGKYILTMAFSPGWPEDQTVIVSVKGLGLYKSMDAGKTFSPHGEALIRNNIGVSRLRYSPQYSVDKTMYVASQQSLLVSEDDGVSWRIIERPVRYENNRSEAMSYRGDWAIDYSDAYSASSASKLKTVDGSFEFAFTGTGFSWIGEKLPHLGSADVILDGEKIATVSQFAEQAENSISVFKLEDLEFGFHTLRIEPVPGSGSKVGSIVIDAIDVFNAFGQDYNRVLR